ncbi:MarR family transcriptional regulator [Enterococcus cecorum]|uniref:MarR family winged helix-turn-helix transcriptional regulator n=1 Tax=Enterococcus cecorum TaxID=44008 RepID=UPI000A78FCD5|nr:MarR family transcriptional regulator [Enterococcus cecorum]MCJ0543541.1 MarR family transcriptional regulator [Enterococcus cecorum]MCJ0547351.1 MarR family transcriptional regulator [Enterococcus cecorum]CAI3396233.1 MarR family transcriptional regulator [Enterococcus cecorum]CAI3507240.1 MarR family transcriptional regulator [Enterococcus cecorum]
MKKLPLAVLVWLRMDRLTARMNQQSNEFLQQDGLTAAQFEVLVLIERYQPISQQQLANQLTVTQGGISRLLQRMQQAGLIEKKSCGKEKHIFLSALGQEKLSQVYDKQITNQAQMFDSLSKDELQTLFQLLTKLSQEKMDRSDE